MRKIFFACFIAMLMLLLPLSAATNSTNKHNPQIITTNDEEKPKIYITEQQNSTINNFIENNFEPNDKQEAYNIKEKIIQKDLQVDLFELSNASLLYNYNPIPQYKLNSTTDKEELNQLLLEYWGISSDGFKESLFGSLVTKIIEMIKDRLGWTYQLYDRCVSLFYNGLTLFVDLIQPTIFIIAFYFVKIVNEILTAPQVFAQAIKELFKIDSSPEEFITILTDFISQFGEDINTFIDEIIGLITNNEIKTYLTQIQSNITWLNQEPWKDKITISGTAKSILFGPIQYATVTCRGISTTTNSQGYFYLEVYPTNTSDDSVPEKQWYGLHNCQITISKNGNVIRETPKLLSYVFSGGKIDNKTYVTLKTRNKFSEYITAIQHLFVEIFERIILFLENNLPIHNLVTAFKNQQNLLT